MIKSLNRPDIAKLFAKDLNLTYKQTEAIIAETEKTVLKFLNERSQVRIHGFGTFYVATMKSHVIKQIRTKTPRIVLEQKKIKFRPSPVFKDAIHQRVRKPASEKKTEDVTAPIKPEIKVEIKPKAAPIAPAKPPISLKPVGLHPRVEKETIKQKITERWMKIAKAEPTPKPQTTVAREAMIVGNLLMQIKKAGYATVNFVYSQDKIINIFAGRPRRQLSHLPREVVGGFLDYADIKEFHIPQERRLVIVTSQARNERIYLHIHSFPIENGSSIQVTIT